jgi:hypothetical protein
MKKVMSWLKLDLDLTLPVVDISKRCAVLERRLGATGARLWA